ncbi:hypothetical protein NHX12_007483 [Muraenolepis orangiensis]|uniref:Uncharacterized protein n=1 Tax=Muraenolepis orangiensis TaxID=630683 RepID=A0A9Q0DQ00_9TELE|nr:hypothetical protein NHX12_007483 [Muraenolepis orangiensis]
MAGDCAYNPHYGTTRETFCASSNGGNDDSVGDLRGRVALPQSPDFEVIDGLLYRKKLERGFINYREVLTEDRRHEAINTFHRRRSGGVRHLSFDETYKCVAENYWWDGMYFHIRSHVLGCPECQCTQRPESQREAGLFCDITLRTEGRAYSAHRAVLAAVSEYFQEIFTEKDVDVKEDVDLTGFSEESLLSLLDFSYSSTLRVRPENLQEVSAMARHLGMWPALEACSALLREHQQHTPTPSMRCSRTGHSGRGFSSAGPGPRSCELQPDRKRKKFSSPASKDRTEDLGLSSDPSPRRASARTDPRLRPQGSALQNGALHSPTHTPTPQPHATSLHSPTHTRMKLIDFKSPSCKKAQASRSTPATPLRHTAVQSGNSQEVQRLLPRPESPRRNKKSHAVPSRPPSTPRRRSGPAPRVTQEPVGVDEEDYDRAQEKYRLMNVLGLQRTALLPRPEDLIGWRQKKRLRKPKANNYSLTKRRKPRPDGLELGFGRLPLSLPLCGPVNTRLLARVIKTEPEDRLIVAERIRAKMPSPPSDRSMRSRGAAPAPPQPTPSSSAFRGRELRSSPRRAENAPVVRTIPAATAFRIIKAEPMDYFISGPPPINNHHGDEKVAARNDGVTRAPRYNGRRPRPRAKLRHTAARHPPGGSQGGPREEGGKAGSRRAPKVVHEGGSPPGPHADKPGGWEASVPTTPTPPPSIYSHPLYRVIKEEPADPLPVARPFPAPPSLDLGKRQSKPPIKLLDPGFLFSFCRPPVGVKREEESVDICLTRSVSREKFAAATPQPRVLRPRRALTSLPQAKATRDMPKKQGDPALASRRCVLLESIRQSRLKQLRRPRQPPDPRASHSCLRCHTSYRDCLGLIMHRLRHVEGKHWPCPLCSKTFFRLRNVKNHIRTHDQKLYKCRSCMAPSS